MLIHVGASYRVRVCHDRLMMAYYTNMYVLSRPCLVNQDGSGTTLNEYSWNNNASVIFLDQVCLHNATIYATDIVIHVSSH